MDWEEGEGEGREGLGDYGGSDLSGFSNGKNQAEANVWDRGEQFEEYLRKKKGEKLDYQSRRSRMKRRSQSSTSLIQWHGGNGGLSMVMNVSLERLVKKLKKKFASREGEKGGVDRRKRTSNIILVALRGGKKGIERGSVNQPNSGGEQSGGRKRQKAVVARRNEVVS